MKRPHAMEVVTSVDSTASGGAPPQVAIIGGGLGGLSAAIHLAAAGYDVTIFEAGERVGGRANLIERAGYRFDTGPSLLNYPWVFEDLFRAAGRELKDYVKLLPVDPSVSFQWPDGTRFTLSSDFGRLLEEFERIEPGSRPRAIAYLRDAEAKYRMAFDKLVTSNERSFVKWLGALTIGELARTSVWRSLDSELGRFFRSRHIREALGSYGMYLGGSPFALPGLFSILAYGEIAYGLWLPEGGIYALVEAIEKLALELGVRIRTGRRVKRIITAGSRVTGIELEDGSVHRSPIVVSNLDVPTTETELLGRPVKTRMTPGVLTFYWGVRGRVDNLGHHTIFLPEDYRGAFHELFRSNRIPRQMPFYVSVPSATDTRLAPPGCTTMFVLVPTPLLSSMPDADWGAITQDVRARVLSRLREHDINIDPARVEVEEVYTPLDWRQRFGLYDGSAFGAAHTLFQLGPLRASNHSKDIHGLYYVGASTTPGTGLPMVVLSGKMAGARVQGSGSGIRTGVRGL